MDAQSESIQSSGADGTDDTGEGFANAPMRAGPRYSESMSQSISHLVESGDENHRGPEHDDDDGDEQGSRHLAPHSRRGKHPGRSPLQHWFFVGGYLWDWLLVGGLFALSAVPQRAVLPVQRHVTEGDPSLSYPLTPGTVSSEVLYACVVLGPFLLFSLTQAWTRSLEDLHHGMLSLGESVSVAFVIKRFLNLVGRHRPDWFARLAAGGDPSGGIVSYPSGHAAYSFCAATVMTLYIWGKLRVLSRPGKGNFAKAVAGMLPIAGAAYIAATRLVDYRHDFSDINAGSFIGLSCGALAYFLNFPSLFDPDSHVARGRGRSGGGGSSHLIYGSSEENSDETEVASQIGPLVPPPAARSTGATNRGSSAAAAVAAARGSVQA